MKTVEFPCYTNFGGCDSADWEIEVELTDEEYARLESALQDIDIEYPDVEFYENKELQDIFKKVYALAVEQATADALFYNEDLKEKYGNDKTWRADMLYSINVEYPRL